MLGRPGNEFLFSEKVDPLYSSLGELLRCNSLLMSLGRDTLCLTLSQRSAQLAWWVTVFCIWYPGSLGCQLFPLPWGGLWTSIKMIFLTFPLVHFMVSFGDKVSPSGLKSSAVVWRKLIRMSLFIRCVRLVSVWQLGVRRALCQCWSALLQPNLSRFMLSLPFSCTFVGCTVESSLAVTLFYSKDQVLPYLRKFVIAASPSPPQMSTQVNLWACQNGLSFPEVL